jgi:hypothetical protein
MLALYWGLCAPGAAKPWERTVPFRFILAQKSHSRYEFIASPSNTFFPAQKFQRKSVMLHS